MDKMIMKTNKSNENLEEGDNFDLEEYGIRKEDYLKTGFSNEKNNLSNLSRRLKETDISLLTIKTTISNILMGLENIKNEFKVDNNLKLVKKEFDCLENNLIEVVWCVDNIIEESQIHGKIFQGECKEAEEKLIELIILIRSMEDKLEVILEDLIFKDVLINKKSLEKLELLVEHINSLSSIFKKIRKLRENIV
jgi:uncharacterized protein YuzB (UPF0349 family)